MTVAQALVAELANDPAALNELRQLLTLDAGEERLVTTREAAKHLGRHPRTVAKWAREGRLKGAYPGTNGWRFKLSELEVLPAEPTDLGTARARRRRAGTSAAGDSIRGKAAAA